LKFLRNIADTVPQTTMSAETHAAAIKRSTPCVARQPILTADESVIGYELFFRESPGETRFTSEAESATSAVIDIVNFLGLGILCDGRLAFINCTHKMLLGGYFALLPPHNVVVEIQRDVPPDRDAVLACERLENEGFSIALDNFVPGDAREALIPFARFLKVDVTKVPHEQYAALAGRYASQERRMVAQKVETRESFLIARKGGFTRFQGYFFRHPENLRARQIPANQATYVRLLAAVSKPQVDLAEVEALIKHEPSLCYRLLRYLNSPLLGLSGPVQSVRSALTFIGEKESVRWIRMATTLVMGQERPSDLVLSSLVRARFCELVGVKVKHGNTDLFLMGMLSLIDSILAVPIGVALDELSLDPDIKTQLLAGKSGKETPLSPIYDLMVAREAAEWEQVTRLGRQLNLSLSFIAEASTQAMSWAHEITKGS
jgi:c-di-GMP-related signal transduction protein